jgi:hypothetical protein
VACVPARHGLRAYNASNTFAQRLSDLAVVLAAICSEQCGTANAISTHVNALPQYAFKTLSSNPQVGTTFAVEPRENVAAQLHPALSSVAPPWHRPPHPVHDIVMGDIFRKSYRPSRHFTGPPLGRGRAGHKIRNCNSAVSAVVLLDVF